MKLSAVAAMARNRVIGANGALPWHLPDDLKWFRDLTWGHTVIMGRKTFESVGKPLKGRRNIVITRQVGWTFSGVEVVQSVESALDLCAREEEVFVVGGSEIYRQTMSYVDRIYLTCIEKDFEGDTYFPENFHWEDFSENEVKRVEEPILHRFLILDKKAKPEKT